MTKEDPDALKRILSSFSCAKDNDIENFLKNKTVDFERLSKARTYLIVDEVKLIAEDRVIILGYVSLALKVLHIPDGLSNASRKKLDGYRGKIHGEPITDIPCYLIGQLARNDSTLKETLTGKDLIEEAQRIIMSAAVAVGGRCMMIECKKEPQLIKFYQDNGFNIISEKNDEDGTTIQMICKFVE